MKIKITVFFLSFVLIYPSILSAQGRGEQVRNQVQTQEQAQVQTQEQNQLVQTSNSRSQVARENMSEVAQKVEELLASPDRQGGIGEEVKEIAKEQKEAQLEIEEELNKMESKGNFFKRLFGPDYGAIRSLNQQLENNRLRMAQLEELSNQTQNKADQEQIQESVEVLLQQNTALQEHIQVEEKTSSLFGWIIRLFRR